jgi:hypothetical protein
VPAIDDFAELFGNLDRVPGRHCQEDQLAISNVLDVGRHSNRIGKIAIPPTPQHDFVPLPRRRQGDGTSKAARADHSDPKTHR